MKRAKNLLRFRRVILGLAPFQLLALLAAGFISESSANRKVCPTDGMGAKEWETGRAGELELD
jgi:hypothetical protein